MRRESWKHQRGNSSSPPAKISRISWPSWRPKPTRCLRLRNDEWLTHGGAEGKSSAVLCNMHAQNQICGCGRRRTCSRSRRKSCPISRTPTPRSAARTRRLSCSLLAPSGEDVLRPRRINSGTLRRDNIPRDYRTRRLIMTCGNRRQMEFQVRDHLELGAALDLIDFETAAEVAGSKFYYMRRAGMMALSFGELRPRHVCSATPAASWLTTSNIPQNDM